MNGPNESKAVPALQVSVFLICCIAYIIQSDYLPKRYFILLALAAIAGYIGHNYSKDPGILSEWGLRTDNLHAALKMAVPFTAVSTLLIMAVSYRLGSFHFNRSIILLMPFYIAWGVLQQFLFQSFLNKHLQKLFRNMHLVIFINAVFFASIHAGNPPLVPAAFVAGLCWSYMFVMAPNIITLGISHGFLAVLYYYLLLARDIASEI
jgi:membrane protease YdiL (CAAX protease family)